ncbi:MAG TPA: hypothetical protein VHM48_06015 [Candidatus Limnocylindrales bacterium]|nr:hypothetical protein [Candidatus Limnocylindrales bacterium]
MNLCIDIAPAFNGPDLDRDAGSLLGTDHGHPTAAGQDLIAATIGPPDSCHFSDPGVAHGSPRMTTAPARVVPEGTFR